MDMPNAAFLLQSLYNELTSSKGSSNNEFELLN